MDGSINRSIIGCEVGVVSRRRRNKRRTGTAQKQAPNLACGTGSPTGRLG